MGTTLLKATFHVYAIFDTRTFAKNITLFKFFVSLLLIIFFEISLIVIYYIHTLCFLNCTYNQFF